jgi:hypothetical protein
MLAARMVPFDLRQAFLELVAAELRGREILGDRPPRRLRDCAHDCVGRGANGGDRMIFTERFLLPCGRTEEERLAIVREWVRKRRGASGRVIAIFPGEDGWVRQLGNKEGIVYFGVVERQCSPSLPRRVRRRESW